VYSARGSDGQRRQFGSSGLLYRSNKLMFDRATLSLWHQLTGEPVLGAAARTSAPLARIASSVATWGEWRRRHPATSVVRLDPSVGERWGFVYLPGAADRKRAGVRFPVWRRSELLPRDEEVFGLVRPGGVKAWPLAFLLRAGVVEDEIGGEPVVLVAEPSGRAVRAFARGRHRFARAAEGTALLDEAGARWRVGEVALEPEAATGEAALPRLAGTNALWFGWLGALPATELGGIEPPAPTPEAEQEEPPPASR
jgi:hypothetical protein